MYGYAVLPIPSIYALVSIDAASREDAAAMLTRACIDGIGRTA